MHRGITYEASRRTRTHFVLPNGTGFWKSEYFATSGAEVPSPQGFLVEQDANQVILPHFHEQNQFQVIVNGGGTLGRSEVAPVTVHYAAAHTGYGPITAGPEGLWYMTLRPMMDNGALFLPESRPRLKSGPKKNWHSEPIAPSDAATLSTLTDIARDEIAAEADGFGVTVLRVPPGVRASLPDPARTGGQYGYVISGSARIGDTDYAHWGCVWVAPQDAALELVAGGEGAELLVLEFPQVAYQATYTGAHYQVNAA